MEKSALYRLALDSLSAHVAILDGDGVILETNRAWRDFAQLNGMSGEPGSIGINYLALCKQAASEDTEAAEVALGIEQVLSGELKEFYSPYPCHSPMRKRWYGVRIVPFLEGEDEAARLIVTHEDITRIMEMYEALQEKDEELSCEREKLNETNIALRVLLRQRDEDRQRIETTILGNVEQLVLPYLKKLQSGLNERQRLLVEVAENNLRDIVSPFLGSLASLQVLLTPQEIEVANLVRNGRSSKEIAELLNLSVAGVDFHRKGLRQKLGLTGTSKNLRSHLLSLK